jgi:hypothetical protein
MIAAHKQQKGAGAGEMWFVFILTPALLFLKFFLSTPMPAEGGPHIFAGTGQGFPCPDAW